MRTSTVGSQGCSIRAHPRCGSEGGVNPSGPHLAARRLCRRERGSRASDGDVVASSRSANAQVPSGSRARGGDSEAAGETVVRPRRCAGRLHRVGEAAPADRLERGIARVSRDPAQRRSRRARARPVLETVRGLRWVTRGLPLRILQVCEVRSTTRRRRSMPAANPCAGLEITWMPPSNEQMNSSCSRVGKVTKMWSQRLDAN